MIVYDIYTWKKLVLIVSEVIKSLASKRITLSVQRSGQGSSSAWMISTSSVHMYICRLLYEVVQFEIKFKI